jgi:peptidoglycan/xylan/chitin deacetylase (PgdA/CDA1 family)
MNICTAQSLTDSFGAITRSDTSQNQIFLCFTGHDFDEGFSFVDSILNKHQIKASFFLTGDFIRSHQDLTLDLHKKGHYIGAHSDKHLLYCDWTKRDSLLLTTDSIYQDIATNLIELKTLGIFPKYFMPPYEWYNEEVVKIGKELGQKTVNFSPGTRSNADYTTPEMTNYVSSEAILKSIFEEENESGMNGFHLLIHPGTNPKRTDKLYYELDQLLEYFLAKGYTFGRF